MTQNSDTQTIAIFIDAENISHQHADFIMLTAKKYGNPIIRRAYADWSHPSVIRWKDEVQKYALQTIHQFAFVSGKNSTDILMAADVLEAVYHQQIKTIILASSDSDFTALCVKLRTLGVSVIGIGKNRANTALMNACEQFYPLPTLQTVEQLPTIASTQLVKSPVINNPNARKDPNADSALLNFINQFLDKHTDGKARLSELGTHFKNSPKFTHKKYGFDKLISFINALNDYETVTENEQIMVRKRKKQVITDDYQTQTPIYQSMDELQNDAKLNNAISNAIAMLKHTHGWAKVGEVSNHLAQAFGIHAIQYGFRSLSELLVCLPVYKTTKDTKGDWVCDSRIDDPDSLPSAKNIQTQSPQNKQQSLFIPNELEFDDVNSDEQTHDHPDALADDSDTAPDDNALDLHSLITIIKQAIAHHQNDDGYAKIGEIGDFVRKQTGYGSQSFGFRHFGELVAKLPDFELIQDGRQQFAKIKSP